MLAFKQADKVNVTFQVALKYAEKIVLAAAAAPPWPG